MRPHTYQDKTKRWKSIRN